jgi:RHS repeat-associated protein
MGADATEHHFTGKERDTESGNDYFGARYYASSMGRWMSPDLVNVTEERMMNPSSTLNKYAYAANNPLKYIDPDGQDITYFYDQSGAAGHAVLFAYNQANGQSAIESFGPASKSLLYRAGEVTLNQVPGKSMFDMDAPKSAQDLRETYAAITIQTSPELTQQVIDYIQQHPDPATWGVLGPNCSSEVSKILRRFKLEKYAGGGTTPKILWANLYTQYVNNRRVNVPTGGNDYGHPRCGGSCMFDLLWQSLPQSHEKVTSRIVPGSVKRVDGQ